MGGLFGGKSSTPKPTPVQRMPDTEDPAIKQAQRRAAADAQTRSGRASTVLTSRAQRMAPAAGTVPYTNTLLGMTPTVGSASLKK
jgi:hypothetical protein